MLAYREKGNIAHTLKTHTHTHIYGVTLNMTEVIQLVSFLESQLFRDLPSCPRRAQGTPISLGPRWPGQVILVPGHLETGFYTHTHTNKHMRTQKHTHAPSQSRTSRRYREFDGLRASLHRLAPSAAINCDSFHVELRKSGHFGGHRTA